MRIFQQVHFSPGSAGHIESSTLSASLFVVLYQTYSGTGIKGTV